MAWHRFIAATVYGSPEKAVEFAVDAVVVVELTVSVPKTLFPILVYIPVYVGTPTIVRLAAEGFHVPDLVFSLLSVPLKS
jgi:hypothetical protein